METQIYKVRDPTGAIREIRGPVGASDEDVIAQAKSLFPGSTETPKPTEPSDIRVALNAASKGIAAVPDALLNTPNRIMNLGRAAFGTAATAAGRPDLAPDIVPDPNFVNRGLRAVGAIGEGGEPVNARQRIIDAAAQGAAGVALNPSGSMRELAANALTGTIGGTASGVTKELTGSDNAAMLAGMLTPFAVQKAGEIGRNRAAEAALNKSRNAERDATLASAREEGFVVAPSSVNPSFLNNRLESIAGKAALKQEAGTRNQGVTTDIAARELGMPAGTPMTEGRLKAYRDTQAAPYREVAAMSPLAAKALEKLQETRLESKLAWAEHNRTANRQAYRDAQAADTKVQTLETLIDKMASRTGNPDLLTRLRESRQNIAKSYDVERAMNVGDASVSAPTIGRALDKGQPLSGGLETIGRFAEGPGRQFVTEGSRISSPGVSGTEMYGMAGLGALGHAALGPAGAVATGLPLVRGPMRNLLLSDAYQNRMAVPNYSQGGMLSRIVEQDPIAQAILLNATQQNQGR